VPKPTHPNAATVDAREQPAERTLADAQVNFGHLVVRRFPRSFRGYDRAAVDRHLEQIRMAPPGEGRRP
jgi:hypothetical protein